MEHLVKVAMAALTCPWELLALQQDYTDPMLRSMYLWAR
jgi:hypothetical protein